MSKEGLSGITLWRRVVLIWQSFKLEILWPVFHKKISSYKCAKKVLGYASTKLFTSENIWLLKNNFDVC